MDDDDILCAVCAFQLADFDVDALPLLLVGIRTDPKAPDDPSSTLLAQLQARWPKTQPLSARPSGAPPAGALLLDNGPITRTDVDKATVKGAPAVPGGALRVYAYVVERRDGAWAVTSSRTTLMV